MKVDFRLLMKKFSYISGQKLATLALFILSLMMIVGSLVF